MTFTVDAVTLDSYAAQDGVDRPDLVKIDIEGTPGDVLAGTVDLIASGTKTWIVEVHGEEERATCDTAFGVGYKVNTIVDRHYLARP